MNTNVDLGEKALNFCGHLTNFCGQIHVDRFESVHKVKFLHVDSFVKCPRKCPHECPHKIPLYIRLYNTLLTLWTLLVVKEKYREI